MDKSPAKSLASDHSFFWGIFAVIVTFILCRLHYWLPAVPQFYFWQFDSQWWWGYQNTLASPEIYAEDIFYLAREQWRFFGDTVIARAIVYFSEISGIPREAVNLTITTANFSLAILGVFALTLYLSNAPFAAAICAILFSQTPYTRWLSYEFVVPKMFAFSLFPFVLLAAVVACKWKLGALIFAVSSIFSLLIYPTSTVYYLPSIGVASLFSIFFFSPTKELKIELSLKFIAACFAILGVALFLQSNKVGLSPPPLEISEYFYKTPVFDGSTAQSYLSEYGIYFALGILSWIAIVTGTKNFELRSAAHFLVIIAIGLLGTGITSHIFAAQIDPIRMIWYWRASYYSFLPLTVLFGMAFYLFALKNQSKLLGSLLSLLAILTFGYLTPDGIHSSAKASLDTLQAIRSDTLSNNYQRELKDIIDLVNLTAKDSALLFPPKAFQGRDTDIIESELKRRVVLSRSNMGLMIVETEATHHYYLLWKRYDSIAGISDPIELASSLSDFASELDAHYLLWPKGAPTQPHLTIVKESRSWVVYAISTN